MMEQDWYRIQKIRNLWLRQIPAYVVSHIVPLLVGIINISVLPRIMGSDMYGAYVLVVITGNMLASIFGEWLVPSGIRFASDKKDNQIWNILGWISIFCGLAATVLAGMLLVKLTPSISVWIAGLFFTLAMTVSKPFTAYIRTTFRGKLIAGYSLFGSFGSLILALMLYTTFGKRLEWFIVGLSIVPFGAFVAYYLRFVWIFGHDKLIIWKSILRFGLPIAITSIGGQVLQFADRYMLGLFKTNADVGVYNVAYNFSDKLLGICFGIFFSSMYPVGSHTWADNRQLESITLLKEIFAFTGLFIGAFLWFQAVSGVSAIRWLAGDEFSPPSLLPILVTMGSWLWYTGILQHQPLEWDKRTVWITAMTLLAAGLNFGFNWLLIPLWGMTGAAIATFFSYAFYLLLSTLLSSIYYNMRIWQLRVLLGTNLGAFVLWYFFRGNGVLWQGSLIAISYVVIYAIFIGPRLFVILKHISLKKGEVE